MIRTRSFIGVQQQFILGSDYVGRLLVRMVNRNVILDGYRLERQRLTEFLFRGLVDW